MRQMNCIAPLLSLLSAILIAPHAYAKEAENEETSEKSTKICNDTLIGAGCIMELGLQADLYVPVLGPKEFKGDWAQSLTLGSQFLWNYDGTGISFLGPVLRGGFIHVNGETRYVDRRQDTPRYNPLFSLGMTQGGIIGEFTTTRSLHLLFVPAGGFGFKLEYNYGWAPGRYHVFDLGLTAAYVQTNVAPGGRDIEFLSLGLQLSYWLQIWDSQ